MKIEMIRTLPTTRKVVYAHGRHLPLWPGYTGMTPRDPEAQFDPGDVIELDFRPSLGLPVKGRVKLEEAVEPELLRMTYRFPGLPPIQTTARLAARGTKATVLTVELLVEEPRSWLGASLRLTGVLRWTLRRELRGALDRLHDLLLTAKYHEQAAA